MNLIDMPPELKHHMKFLVLLVKSLPGVWFVAYQAWIRGHAVKIGKITVSECPENNSANTDSGDLEVEYSGEWKHIEVKHISENFTSRRNWPYKNFIVDRIQTYDKKTEPVFMYAIVSHDYKAIAFVDVSKTRSRWFIADHPNKMYGSDEPPKIETYYHCPIELVTWSTIKEEIQNE